MVSRAAGVAFRFAFSLAVLLYFPFPLDSLPVVDELVKPLDQAQTRAFIWLTVQLLDPPPEELPELTGSGDVLWNYVQLATRLALAVLGTAAWTLLDRRRAGYRRLGAWLNAGLRWVLCFTMLSYGFAKVFPLQMPWMPGRLIEPLGEMSPMGLLWTFMSASAPYEMLSGWCEVIGGLLLVFRRTAGLGALMLLAVLGNVVALNYCYDVPVKLYSTQLWLTAAFIAAPDARRIFRLLVLRRTTEPAPEVPLVTWEPVRRRRWLGPALTVAWVGWTVFGNVRGSLEGHEKMAEMRADVPVEGIFQVESFTPAASPSFMSGTPWARVGGSFRGVSVLRADGSFLRLRTEAEKDGTTKVTYADTKETGVIRVERPDPEHARIIAEGGFELKLKKVPDSAFNLPPRLPLGPAQARESIGDSARGRGR